ncbi:MULTISPECIES: hypothetical protein [Pseudomonas]|jgi:hypothetical protein|uniref:Uncharacterized protein n=1 Tax=Pseudomonas synxantha TaxID=47883 RepID=A0A5D3GGM9_9PSED|nr:MULTISPECIES: hypothetical protein [Pseudomonas]KFF43292.1 hypothetical protein JH25_05770 [Pseudomonas sp. BRG-100]MCK3839295.1 hypothetical protein [Pseudomonas sp. NCIMB 10586]MCK3861167.1 hypothetical protein [Pseudomonas sp. B329]OPB08388.1 hypothetical protein BFW89_07695 [Pseudomonas synxantha]TYK54089.1 hypothetical protein FXO26_29245 [Pseudomonas synxantha]
MSYLEDEIDAAFNTLNIGAGKLDSSELNLLINALTRKFFKSQSNVLDPIELNEKSTEHNPDFWKEIPYRISERDLILVVFDSAYTAWKIDNSRVLASVLGETTGYPFWITDSEITFLVHMDDHNCVIWA